MTKMMLASGVTNIIGCDRQRRALDRPATTTRPGEMTEIKRWYAESTNPEKLTGAPPR